MNLDLSREIVVRWNDADPKHIPLLKQGGVTCAVLPAKSEAFERGGIKTVAISDLHFAGWKDIASAPAGKTAVLADGLWPGIARTPVRGRGGDEEIASASREPWIDADSFWCGCLRAVLPQRPALLGYEPNEQAGVKKDRVIRYDALELALIDAWAGGGNWLVAIEPEYRKGLLAGEEKALEAWRAFGHTAQWLRENVALFRQPMLPMITQLVEPGTESAELANLMYRRGASPALASATDPPPPAPGRILALVAASINPPSPAVVKRILAHAEAGASVITDGAWWRGAPVKPVKKEEDRDFYALGRGQLIIYKETIADPSEFALDAIDVITHRKRAMRVWNAPSAIALATACPRGVGSALMHVVNYGFGGGRWETLARIQGVYTKATLAGPGRTPAPLKTAKRGTTTEVEIPRFTRLAVVIFS